MNTALTSITISAGKSSGSGTLTITPTDDSIVEGGETIVLSGTTTTSLTVSDATITLTDDNKSTASPGDIDSAELSITGPTSNVSEGSDSTFSVTLSAAVAKDVTVAWSAPLSADAAESADLGATSGTVTFDAGSAAGATKEITITAMDDSLSEAAEAFTVTLGDITSTLPASQVSLKSGASSAQATIAESDPITVSISGPSSVDEGDATSNYTVSLSPSGVTPTADLTVSYAAADGTATAGTDFTAKSGTLTFSKTAAGSQTFTVQTTEDSYDEGTGETFTVSISGPTGGGGPSPTLGKSSITTTITDDDVPVSNPDRPYQPPLHIEPLVDIRLSVDPDSVYESDGETSFDVTATRRAGPRSTDVKVQLTLAGTATRNADYTVSTALPSITIPANSASGTETLTLTINQDDLVEGDETIVVGGNSSGLRIDSDTINVRDGESPNFGDSPYLSITGPSAIVAEGSNAEFIVTLSRTVPADVTVQWSAPLASDSAVAADLSQTSGAVTFPANSIAGATQTITITATDDRLSETAETFTVKLGAITSTTPSSQVSLRSGASSARATIAASDPVAVHISGSTRVNEGSAAAYTVSLHPSGVIPTVPVVVSYATSDGTAKSGIDYVAKSGTFIFTGTSYGAKSFTVQTAPDTQLELGETFKVSISYSDFGVRTPGTRGVTRSQTTTRSVTTTIADDDGALGNPITPPLGPDPIGPERPGTPNPGGSDPAPTPSPTPGVSLTP